MTWPEAQTFCRKHHTDLVSGTKQLEERISTITGIPYWIGLFRDPWRWSDGRSSFFRPWSQTFPGNQPGNNKCAALHKDGSWNTNDCNSAKPFFCYSGEFSTVWSTGISPETVRGSVWSHICVFVCVCVLISLTDNVILIKENKTWEEAINHCRENYNDLISITDAEQQRWVQERAKNASSSHVWLALRFTCILEAWFWVTDERVDYKNWASEVKMDDCDMSGAMEARGEHKWIKEDDMRKFNFFCSKFWSLSVFWWRISLKQAAVVVCVLWVCSAWDSQSQKSCRIAEDALLFLKCEWVSWRLDAKTWRPTTSSDRLFFLWIF